MSANLAKKSQYEFFSDPEAFTDLNTACWEGDFRAVRDLVNQGHEAVNSTSGCRFFTPLHTCACRGHAEIAQFLMDKGADVDAQSAEGYTPLNTAIWYCSTNVALLLLKKADVNIRAHNGCSPLISAIWRKNQVLVEILLEKGAEVNIRNEDKLTPLHFAVTRRQEGVVRLLLAYGASVSEEDWLGRTPAAIALENGDLDLAELLSEERCM